MRPFLAFARAPLIWSAATLLLYAPFAFIEPVIQPPPPDCTDWLWCDSRYVGMVFRPVPDPASLYALLIIPGAFLCFFAARVAARGPNRHAHWFMAPFALTFVAFSIYFFFWPIAFFISLADSHRPTVIVQSEHLALVIAIMASVPFGLIALGGALIRRGLTRSVPTAAA